jgi:glycosyltransferase involved in cell wall biosynthesis
LRVLHLGKFYPPHAGGVERHLYDLSECQAQSGLEVACLVHATPGKAADAPRTDTGRVRVERVPCHGQLLFAPVSPAWPWHFRRLMRDFRPDVLHVHVPNPSTFWLLLNGAARRTPTIVHWHADIPEDSGHRGLKLAYPPYRGFERALNARAARIVATSNAYLDASRALAPFRSKCEVIALGIADAAAPGRAPIWPAGRLKVLAVGRMSYYKGFDVLLDAIAQEPSASLVLVGHGEQRASLEARVATLGLGERVMFAGNLDDAGLEAAYRACDLFCLPSLDRAEAFGMVLLEAMRAGKPVLASDIPGSGVGTVVVQGVTGKLVPPRDVASLREALGHFANAPDELDRMGRAGQGRWEGHYRIDAVTKRWIQLYRETLAAPTTG